MALSVFPVDLEGRGREEETKLEIQSHHLFFFRLPSVNFLIVTKVRMASNPRVALVTGGSRGVGYYIGKELLKNIPNLTCYMAAREVENLSGHSALLGMELGGGVRARAKFVNCDIRSFDQIEAVRDEIMRKHGGLDILVNNASIYRPADYVNTQNFTRDIQEILQTNYWGTKKVISTFWECYNPHSRIVNITSHLAHVMTRVSTEEERMKAVSRARFGQVKTIPQLDSLVMKFQSDAEKGKSRQEGKYEQ